MNIGYKTDAENVKRQALIDLMKDMPLSTLQISFIYAKNYAEYGEDVTRTWLTVTENVSALEKAYRKGYYDALQRQAELDKIRGDEINKREVDKIIEMLDDLTDRITNYFNESNQLTFYDYERLVRSLRQFQKTDFLSGI